ncbi:phasin family protein [Herbaspirillum sp. GCM10030257]|uniref:phasin family protein n=1 Tax=Herbaspirillum sp. GCM10030257 TaxID=3273393 RepID=UPI003613A1FE
MVKKLKALSQSDDEQLAEAVRASAQQIWQAGLGAFAKAHGSGGKVFAKLVKEGTEVQQQARQLVEGKTGGAKSAVGKSADVVRKRASGSWDKLEQIFEERVARSLKRLGMPSQSEIDLLTKRVEQLSKTVAALSGKKTPTAKATAKPVTTKTAAKKTVKKASGVATKTRLATKPAARKSTKQKAG